MHKKSCKHKFQGNLKSQASLEFLATYAWAFIVIAVTVSALYYFGVLDFNKYLPQKCTFPSQFKCLDFSLNPTQVKIKLANNIGEDICITSTQITNEDVPPISCTPPSLPQGSCAPTESEWLHATNADLNFIGCSGGGYLPDARVELRITMSYYAKNTPSKPIHLVNGKINGKITSS